LFNNFETRQVINAADEDVKIEQPLKNVDDKNENMQTQIPTHLFNVP